MARESSADLFFMAMEALFNPANASCAFFIWMCVKIVG